MYSEIVAERLQSVQSDSEAGDDDIKANNKAVESDVDGGDQRTKSRNELNDGRKAFSDDLIGEELQSSYERQRKTSTRTVTTLARTAATAASTWRFSTDAGTAFACVLALFMAVVSWLTSVVALAELAGVFVLMASDDDEERHYQRPRQLMYIHRCSYGVGA